MLNEKRKYGRHANGDYMRVLDNVTHELIGYLTDISLGGFRLESPKGITVDQDYNLRLEYTREEKEASFIVFTARARWVQPDPVMPYEYIGGFQIVTISPSENEIYKKIVENYGPAKHNW